jgi:hypothetical protein
MSTVASAGGTDNAITFGEYAVDGDYITVDIMYTCDQWLAGFQFDIVGAEVFGASGGLCSAYDWLLENSADRVIGVGLGGWFIEPLATPTKLLELKLRPTAAVVSFEAEIFANPDAEEIPIDATDTLDLSDLCTGDLNGDLVVNGADLGLMLVAFSGSDPNADLNNDGVVNGADLGLMLVAWGDC